MSGRISARKHASNVIVSKGPDVCLTRRGNAVLPVPYSSIAFLDTAVRYSSSVRNNGRYDFQLNSRCAKSKGHKPGKEKGVNERGYTGPAHVEVAADYFFSEGFAVASHRDPAWINRPDQGKTEPFKGMKTVTIGDTDQTREEAKSQEISTADKAISNPPRSLSEQIKTASLTLGEAKPICISECLKTLPTGTLDGAPFHYCMARCLERLGVYK